MFEWESSDNKWRVTNDNGKVQAFRHGELVENATDNLHLAMMETLEVQEEKLMCLMCLMDTVVEAEIAREDEREEIEETSGKMGVTRDYDFDYDDEEE